MKGDTEKTIAPPSMGDKELILFIYWLLSVETKTNLLESGWLPHCFLEATCSVIAALPVPRPGIESCKDLPV
ncbi:MAG: hypothetical protein ACOX0F_08975 [Syntrophomonadaceae bacterium]